MIDGQAQAARQLVRSTRASTDAALAAIYAERRSEPFGFRLGMTRDRGAAGTARSTAIREVERMRPVPRLALVVMCAVAAVLMWTPSAYARGSTTTVALTLRGPVPANAGFYIGVGSSADWVCVGKAEQSTWPKGSVARPVCRSGVTYTQPVRVAKGASVHYEIGMGAPRQRVLWSGTLTGDGHDHRLSYVYAFGLPATDTVAASAASAASSSGGRLGSQLVLALAATVAGWFAWSAVDRRRRSARARR